MGGHRSGMHYRTRNTTPERTSATVHARRDAAYREALGLSPDAPLPSELGKVRHQRPQFDTGYLGG